ncbi:hypothetical protein [Acinetobacter pseudolwoffii]|uniref:hypothetical protein n=1 Tax=Acinetobacter pseudolwoffii TaxID=2053287 RepID=UPI0025781F26|nr:hypothetical protein [Acinetobacter pseudolwoffii]MDM1341410.1 hypothetical protein [Acinetobacter pseudolwoffii]
MLEFWYSERCHRQIKLVVIIATCIVIYAASTVAQLDPVLVGLSLGIGIVVHLLHHFRSKISKANPYAHGFGALSRVIPIIALITLFGYLPEQHQQWAKFALGLQCLGFAAIGLFIVSVYENRAKRFEE